MPPESRFETDLQAVRAARGLSLAQIQQETRIPVDVLRRFEEGDLIGDPTYNEVYLKAFLKSYAKAVGASPAEVMKAYSAQRSGSYQGQLSPNYKGSSPPAEEPAAVETSPAPATTDAPAETGTEVPGPVAAVRESPPARKEPMASIQAQRVSRPSVPSARHSYDKNWGLIIGLFLGAVVILGGILWFLVWDGGDSTPDEYAGEESGIAVVDSSVAGMGAGAVGKRLQIPIQVTVTAGGNGLQNFRVTEAPEERLGHWIEPGESMTYESDSLVVLWGEGAEGLGTEATLELQGERWSPASGSVLRIDRQNGQRLLDSLATAPSSAPQPAETTSDGA